MRAIDLAIGTLRVLATMLGALRLAFVRSMKRRDGYFDSKLSDALHFVMNASMAAMFSPWWSGRMVLPVMILYACLAALLVGRAGVALIRRKPGKSFGAATILPATAYHLVVMSTMIYSQYLLWRGGSQGTMAAAPQAGKVILAVLAAVFLLDAVVSTLGAIFLPEVVAKALGDYALARGSARLGALGDLIKTRGAFFTPHVIMDIAMGCMILKM